MRFICNPQPRPNKDYFVIGEDDRGYKFEFYPTPEKTLTADNLQEKSDLLVAINTLKKLDSASLKYARKMLLGLLLTDALETPVEESQEP